MAWLVGAALLVAAVLVLRAPDESDPQQDDSVDRPVRIDRFAADNVVLPVPDPQAKPELPGKVVTVSSPGRLRVAWAEAVAGGAAPAAAVGYEVRWATSGAVAGTRLVIAPETQLDRLTDGQRYDIEVRSVDAYGRRSPAQTTSGVPGPSAEPWRDGLTGLLEDFSDQRGVQAETPGSRWHVSGYRGCVDLGTAAAGSGLPIELGCGADVAVLRARTPLRLAESPDAGGVLGRVAVVTDAVGPGGELTVDLVPGAPDRVGAGRVGAGTATAATADPALPPGTLRAVANDHGVQVRTHAAVAGPAAVPATAMAPQRGPGVLHLFEVLVTTSGVQVRQDGLLVAAAAALPTWREASVLVGVRGPEGRRSRVHLAAAGFTGPPSQSPTVVEVPVNTATRQVLRPQDQAPGLGIARTPLLSAASARLVATIAHAAGLDPTSVAVQMGDTTIAARPATGQPPSAPGAAVTVVADLPPGLVGDHGQSQPLTPFVLRAHGSSEAVTVLECYLEITPGPGWRGPDPAAGQDAQRRPPADALPTVRLTLSDSAGELSTPTTPVRDELLLTVTLDATVAQWDSGAVAGIQGFELWLDGHLIAGVPTAAEGPGVGGRYTVPVFVSGLASGSHVIEVRELGHDGAAHPASLLSSFVVE